MAWTSGALNSSSYEGDWQDDKKNGKGVFKWAVGDSYEGDYKDNKRHGCGV